MRLIVRRSDLFVFRHFVSCSSCLPTVINLSVQGICLFLMFGKVFVCLAQLIVLFH